MSGLDWADHAATALAQDAARKAADALTEILLDAGLGWCTSCAAWTRAHDDFAATGEPAGESCRACGGAQVDAAKPHPVEALAGALRWLAIGAKLGGAVSIDELLQTVVEATGQAQGGISPAFRVTDNRAVQVQNPFAERKIGTRSPWWPVDQPHAMTPDLPFGGLTEPSTARVLRIENLTRGQGDAEPDGGPSHGDGAVMISTRPARDYLREALDLLGISPEGWAMLKTARSLSGTSAGGSVPAAPASLAACEAMVAGGWLREHESVNGRTFTPTDRGRALFRALDGIGRPLDVGPWVTP